jgi:hypothetical protein
MMNSILAARLSAWQTKLAVAAIVALATASGCSSETKEAPPAAAVPGQTGAASNTVASNPGTPPSAAPAGTFSAQEYTAGGSAAGQMLGQALFSSRPAQSPYGYSKRGYAGSASGTSIMYRSGTSMPYYPSGSGIRSFPPATSPTRPNPF